MDLVKTILNVLAALMLAMLPAAMLFWLLIHPLASVWRRLGPVKSYSIVGGVCLAVAYIIWTVHDPLMRVHWGYRPATVTTGIMLYVVGAVLDIWVQRRLRIPILLGLPELSSGPNRLLTEGAYNIVRHPRYLAALVGIIGFSLICNYPALYAVLGASIPVGWLLIVLEERELRERFGDEYEEYCRQVPRIIPRWQGR